MSVSGEFQRARSDEHQDEILWAECEPRGYGVSWRRSAHTWWRCCRRSGRTS